MPELKRLAALCYYVVGRELPESTSAEDDEQILTILRHSWCLHGRVANGERVHVPSRFAQHRPWLDRFLSGWR